jgi:hypothetical protein
MNRPRFILFVRIGLQRKATVALSQRLPDARCEASEKSLVNPTVIVQNDLAQSQVPRGSAAIDRAEISRISRPLVQSLARSEEAVVYIRCLEKQLRCSREG